jgi:hypothetical protein
MAGSSSSDPTRFEGKAHARRGPFSFAPQPLEGAKIFEDFCKFLRRNLMGQE